MVMELNYRSEAGEKNTPQATPLSAESPHGQEVELYASGQLENNGEGKRGKRKKGKKEKGEKEKGRRLMSYSSRRFCHLLPWLAAASLLIWFTGCQKSSPQASATGKRPATDKKEGEAGGDAAPLAGPVTARAVLEKMAAAYHNASTYQDLGMVRLTAQVGKEKIDETLNCSVVFVRPNKLQMKVNAANVVADGAQFRATIDDLPGQVLTKDDPAKLTMPAIYGDGILATALNGGPAGPPRQILLLLADDSLKLLLAGADEPTLDQPGKIEDHDCYRVKLNRPDGTAVLWIDQQTFALRRLIPSTDALRQMLEGNTGSQVESLSLVVEFTGARLDAAVDAGHFAFDLPAGAEAVKYFLPPLARLLGKKFQDFKFVNLEGKPVTRDSLAGKIVVLDFWATWCRPCRESLPNLEKVYQKYKNNQKLAFLAVSVDEPTTKDNAVRKTVEGLKVSVPIARDTTGAMGVRSIPITLLIGPNGVLQDYEDFANPNLTTELPAKIEKLLAGEDLYPAWLRRFEEMHQQYQRQLEAEAKGGPPGDAGIKEISIPKADIAPKSQPKNHKLTSLWKCTELKGPGNILVVPQAGGPPRLAVVDSWNSVAEIGLDGKVLATHKLDIQQKEEVVCNLRTAVGGDGKRLFVGFAGVQQRLHLLDQDWKLLLHYPADALQNRHKGIADVQFGDLDGDGTLRLYVSYWDVVGVQAVSLAGERVAFNRDQAVNNVMSMAVGPAEKGHRDLICVSGDSLVLLDSKLQRRGEILVPQQMLQYIAAADLKGDGQLHWCALAARKLGDNLALGINLNGDVLWNYTLPSGVQPQPIERVVAGKATSDGPGQWLLPGPDGSIHILALDGKLIDRFNYGVALAGLAAVEIDGKPALVVSSANGVEAWRVE
jgi:thiol-disulfide isomerase/thioredoxin